MPNRILRDYTDSAAMNSLSDKAECLFVRLLTKADDFGSFHGNPVLIRAALYPLRSKVSEKDILKCVGELAKSGLVIRYSVKGKEYLRILNFGQRLRSMRGKFPEPENLQDSPLPASCGQLSASRPPEGKVETETETKAKGTIVPPAREWVREYFIEKNSTFNEAEKFFDYYQTNGWVVTKAKSKMKDWHAAVSNWLRRSGEFTPTNQNQNHSGQFANG